MRTHRLISLLLGIIALLYADGVAALDTGDFDFELRKSPEFDMRDRAGLRRDTWYFLGYQWVTIGILYVAPESVSGWSDEQKEGYDMSYWWDNVTHPQWDSDDFYLNYIMHPYWGASYYVRARERGYNDRQAFWYAALLSCMYEFGAEALFEEVSIQDVFVTPIGGTVLGRYFMHVRDGIRYRDAELGYRSRRDKWLWVLTDPLGALNNQIDRLTGRNVHLQLRPYRYVPRYGNLSTVAPITLSNEPVYGIGFHIEW
jgi:hypothetical protein